MVSLQSFRGVNWRQLKKDSLKLIGPYLNISWMKSRKRLNIYNNDISNSGIEDWKWYLKHDSPSVMLQPPHDSEKCTERQML